MAVVLSQSKLQSSTRRKFNANLFQRDLCLFIGHWLRNCFVRHQLLSSPSETCNALHCSQSIFTAVKEPFLPININGGCICPRRYKKKNTQRSALQKKTHKDLLFSEEKWLKADNLIRWVLFQAMQKPVRMININLHGNTFVVYV